MWSVGLLLMEVLGGQRPEDHVTLLLDPVYLAEAQKGLRDPVGLPGQSQLMEYLASHVAEQASYSDKVCQCMHAICLRCCCTQHLTDTHEYQLASGAFACTDLLRIAGLSLCMGYSRHAIGDGFFPIARVRQETW